LTDLSDPAAVIQALLQASREQVNAALADLTTPVGSAPSGMQLLVRAAAYTRLYELDATPAALKCALADYDASPVFGPHRDRVTRRLVLAQVRAVVQGKDVDMRRIHSMLDVSDDPAAPGTLAVLHGLVHAACALVDEPGYDIVVALRHLEELAPTVPPESEFERIYAALRQALVVARGQRTGRYQDAADAARFAAGLSASFEPNSGQRLRAELMRLGGEAMTAAQRGDIDAAVRVMPDIQRLIEQLPLNDPATGQLRAAMNQLDALLGGSTEPLRVDINQPGLSRGERAFRLFLLGTSECSQAAGQQDPVLLASGVARLREATELAAENDPKQCNYHATLGRMECTLFQLHGRRDDLASAVQHLETAVRLAEHPGHPLWSLAGNSLALAYRLGGRLADGRRWGLHSLRGNTWTVLLQERPEHATDAARHAADEAVEVARWCIADGDAASAATALDAGRSLMIAATRVTASVSERLVAANQPTLAQQWLRQDSHGDPLTGSDLRYRVLATLAGLDQNNPRRFAERGLLDPPDLDEVRAALATVNADALVYLLPADPNGGGVAVLVPRREAPYHLPLPYLTARAGELVHRYGQTLATRDASVPNASEPTRRWRLALDELCGWAWSVAVGPLLDEVARWRLDRVPRLVLVPMGDLATVPWHAARSPRGRYAVQDAVFSYGPSARILCDCAWRKPVGDDSGSLVVGDPTGDLPDAREEAVAIRDAYYPSAVLLGAHDDPADLPAATPQAVLDWLGSTDVERRLLHLACHGALRPGGAHGSYLTLAGRAELSAQALLETRRRASLDLVVLAACTTGVPSGSYDEALSISTAFLAVGAATVFGSLWPVPGDATSVLMFMAHHYLRAKGLRPADALHQAQLWMLDAGRQIPPEMPPGLAARAALVDRHDIAAWAAFTHLGR
jgi:hypothetical protein